VLYSKENAVRLVFQSGKTGVSAHGRCFLFLYISTLIVEHVESHMHTMLLAHA
jgi:hypothetical protein